MDHMVGMPSTVVILLALSLQHKQWHWQNCAYIACHQDESYDRDNWTEALNVGPINPLHPFIGPQRFLLLQIAMLLVLRK